MSFWIPHLSKILFSSAVVIFLFEEVYFVTSFPFLATEFQGPRFHEYRKCPSRDLLLVNLYQVFGYLGLKKFYYLRFAASKHLKTASSFASVYLSCSNTLPCQLIQFFVIFEHRCSQNTWHPSTITDDQPNDSILSLNNSKLFYVSVLALVRI